MKAIDTNVLVRYFTRDDEKQFAAAQRVIARAAETGERLLIHPIVLCELVWVLGAIYRVRKAALAELLEEILVTAEFEVHDAATVWAALDDFRSGKADFADYYIGRANGQAGAESTFTFDRSLKAAGSFELL